jgi:hypothetical protein
MAQDIVNPDLLNPEPGNGPPWYTDVKGNLIGTAANGIDPLGNSGPGISATLVSRAVVGGDAPGASNRIWFNAMRGIIIADDASVTIAGNSIDGNTGLEIDIDGDNVVEINDAGDGDGGANLHQNYPVIETANEAAPAGTTITGTLSAAPNTTYTIRLYASSVCDPSGFGGGQSQRGNPFDVTTDGTSTVVFNTVISGAPAGWFVTATATDLLGNTSEFSQCRVVAP